MTIEVEIAGTGQIAEFPDGTAPEAIQQALSSFQQPAQPPEQGLVGTAIGAADILASGAVGAGKEAIEGISGIGGLLMGKSAGEASESAQALTGELPEFELGEQGQALINRISEKFQASPEFIKDIVGAAATLGPSIGESAFQATGSPLAGALVGAIPGALEAATGVRAPKAAIQAAAPAAQAAQSAADVAADIFTSQSPVKQKIAEKLAAGTTDADTAGFKLDTVKDRSGRPRAVSDALEKSAIDQGFDKGVIASIKGANPADKTAMKKMVNVMQRGKNNARFAATNRPSDILGESVMKRVNIVQSANRAAGKAIDKAAEALRGQPVDISNAVNGFSEGLDSLGVRLVPDSKGGVKPDFELSQLSPGDRGPIKEVIRQMNIQGAGGVDALTAHKMKRIIDNNVTFGKVKTGLSGDAERALKSFRAGLDESLDSAFPEYNRVNTAYSETIGALDALQDVAGKKMNLSGPQADKATGTLMRRVLSNAQSRITLLDSVDEIERIAKKYEGFKGELDPTLIEGPRVSQLNDDLINQVLFVDELDAVFGPVARTSLQGQFKQGASALAEAQVSPVTAGIKAGAGLVDKAKGINDQSKFKAIKQLLGSGD